MSGFGANQPAFMAKAARPTLGPAPSKPNVRKYIDSLCEFWPAMKHWAESWSLSGFRGGKQAIPEEPFAHLASVILKDAADELDRIGDARAARFLRAKAALAGA